MLKKILFLLILNCVFISGLQAQTNNKAALQVKDSLRGILDKLPLCKKIETQKNEFGENHIWVYQNALQMVRVNGIDHGIQKTVEWYYLRGEILFSETNWINVTTNENVFHEACYFLGGKLVAWLNFENVWENPNSESFKNTGTELITYCQKQAVRMKKWY